MKQVPERRLEPPREWEREPQCPVCGRPCDKVFRDWHGFIFGCDECVEIERSTDCEECYE